MIKEQEDWENKKEWREEEEGGEKWKEKVNDYIVKYNILCS